MQPFKEFVMNIRFTFALIAVIVCALPAAAEECLVCDKEIVMTPVYAQCFIDQAAAYLNEMQQKDLPFQLISLATCVDNKRGARGADGAADSSRQLLSLGDIQNARSDTPQTPTTTFILDRAGIECLRTLIRAQPAGSVSSQAFRPAEMCPP